MSATDNDHDLPLWNYVTKKSKAEGGGGNVSFTCHYCNRNYKGSYSTVKAHLLLIPNEGIRRCPKVSLEHLAEMKKLVDDAETKAMSSKPKQVSLPNSGSNAVTDFSCSIASESKFKNRKGTVVSAFNGEAREEMNRLIARMFYSAGLPFNFAKNPYFIEVIRRATANSRTLRGYIPPSYNQLRTNILQDERNHVERLLDPIKSTWGHNGVTIVSDGWTDFQRRPIINFIVVSESGPMFLKAINCQGEYKDKFFIVNLLKETINEVGADNVVQVITDNALVCKSAGLLIETHFPHIFWTPCVVHTLNLAFKNICATKNTEANAEKFAECSWIKDIITDVVFIRKFIMNHSMRLAMFNEHSKLKLLTIAVTRFSWSIIMLQRLVGIKEGLQSMVISPKCSSYRDDDVGKAQFVKEKILDDLWWGKVDYILVFTKPIYDMLRHTDTDRLCLHLVYDMWESMIEKVRKSIYLHEGLTEFQDSSFYYVVHEILASRWGKSNTPLNFLAHSLNPRYYSQEWLNGSPGCVAPHLDDDISQKKALASRDTLKGTTKTSEH